jgi:nucleoside-diphosphate-sugar epimerase
MIAGVSQKKSVIGVGRWKSVLEICHTRARSFVAILIVGGAGYIGSHVARALRSSGYEVMIYDNLSTGCRRLAHGFELVRGDVADEAALRPALARVDAVMHFAAHASWESPLKTRVSIFAIMSLQRSTC